MDFVAVLRDLVPFFEARKIRFAVIGGVGLGGYGMSRATEKHGLRERYRELEAT